METIVDRSLRHWWVFLIRGLLFILLGVYMIANPVGTYAALGFVFGLVILLAGIAELLHAYQDRGAANRGWHLVIGLIDVIIGIVLMAHLLASADVLRIIVGIWFVVKGISMFSFSGRLGRSWIITLGAIITLLLGILILFDPAFGAAAIVLWTAIAFIITGVFNCALAFRMKRIEG